MSSISAVDIVIVNWNSGDHLADCVTSIREHAGAELGRLFIVDNGSTDGSLDVDVSGLPGEIVHEQTNLGFAKACNLGAARGQAPFILFLNPDARLMTGTLPAMLRFMHSEAAAEVGICGPHLVDETGRTQRHCARFPGWRTYFGRATGLDRLLPNRFPPHYLDEFDHETSRQVDQVIGAAFMVRRPLFEQLGGFDERFFVYFEELDLSLRARKAGWLTWYLAEATAFHKGGGSSENVKAARLFYSTRSRLLYAMKHFAPAPCGAVIASTLLAEPIARLGRAILRRSPQEAWDTLRGYGMVWRALPGVLRSRPSR